MLEVTLDPCMCLSKCSSSILCSAQYTKRPPIPSYWIPSQYQFFQSKQPLDSSRPIRRLITPWVSSSKVMSKRNTPSTSATSPGKPAKNLHETIPYPRGPHLAPRHSSHTASSSSSRSSHPSNVRMHHTQLPRLVIPSWAHDQPENPASSPVSPSATPSWGSQTIAMAMEDQPWSPGGSPHFSSAGNGSYHSSDVGSYKSSDDSAKSSGKGEEGKNGK